MLAPVASARKLVRTPEVLLVPRLPPSMAVEGLPEAALKVGCSIQPVSSLVFHPPLRHSPCTPTGEESSEVTDRRCRWSVLDSPRSAARSFMFWTTDPPPPPVNRSEERRVRQACR